VSPIEDVVKAVLLIPHQPRKGEKPGGIVTEFRNNAAQGRRANHAADCVEQRSDPRGGFLRFRQLFEPCLPLYHVPTRLANRANHRPDRSGNNDLRTNQTVWELRGNGPSLVLGRKGGLSQAISQKTAEKCLACAMAAIGILSDIGG
jgi:hypothetical protein